MLDPYSALAGQGTSAGLLSLDPELSAARKRTCPSSDSLHDGSKRMHEFTDSVPDDYWVVASSPPLAPQPDDEPGVAQVLANLNDEDEAMATDDDMDVDGATDPGGSQATVTGAARAGAFSSTTTLTPFAGPTTAAPAGSFVSFAGTGLTRRGKAVRDASIGVPAGGALTSRAGRSLASVASARSLGSASSFNSFASHRSLGRAGSFAEIPLAKMLESIIDNPDDHISGGRLDIDVTGRGLTELPGLIGDLAYLVTFHEKPLDIHLYLSKNALTTLPLQLFMVDRLTVLTLRDNQLAELSPLIGNLRNLRELNVSHNRLQCLPAEILGLDLQTLTVYPNDLLPLPAGATRSPGNAGPLCLWREHTVPVLPTLEELALRTLAELVEAEAVPRSPNVPEKYRRAVARALEANAAGRRCSFCERTYVSEAAATYEWWNVFGQFELPLKRTYCHPDCFAAATTSTRPSTSSPAPSSPDFRPVGTTTRETLV